MEDSIEYLNEWPPPSREEQRKRGNNPDKPTQETSPKRVKRDSKLSVAERELVVLSPDVPTSSLLARWWKSRSTQGSSGPGGTSTISSNNPRTMLHHISKQPEAREFLSARVEYLETLDDGGPVVHHALAATHRLLQNYTAALGYARRALEEDPANQEMIWHMELLLRQTDVLKRQAEQTRLVSSEHLQMSKPTQVERRSGIDLSYEEFFTHYALTHTPVVITDVVGEMVTQSWTFDYIKKVIGSKVAPLRKVVSQSVEWAKLEPAGESQVTQFIDSIFRDTTNPTELKYLFDWSLPLYCPELAEQLTIPRYFAGDFLQRTPPGSLYRDSWPSLFVSPAGITSELHVDAFGSNFWMALFQGKKRWTFFPPDDLPLLYPLYTDSTDAVFQVDLSRPDLTLHPLLSLSHPTQCTLSQGELLFVPAGSPHRVENLSPSLAISANFVDSSNFGSVLGELRVDGLRDPRARDLVEVLEEEEFCRSVDYGQKDLQWKEFKTSVS